MWLKCSVFYMWMLFMFLPMFTNAAPTEDDEVTNKTVPGPASTKPFIGIGAGWNPLYNAGRETQGQIQDGISKAMAEVSSVMHALSGIFSIFGPITGPVRSKNYVLDSPGADEVEFIDPMVKQPSATRRVETVTENTRDSTKEYEDASQVTS